MHSWSNKGGGGVITIPSAEKQHWMNVNPQGGWNRCARWELLGVREYRDLIIFKEQLQARADKFYDLRGKHKYCESCSAGFYKFTKALSARSKAVGILEALDGAPDDLEGYDEICDDCEGDLRERLSDLRSTVWEELPKYLTLSV